MKIAVLICPGRGTSTKTELGSRTRLFPDRELLATFNAHREALGQETLNALDAAPRHSVATHSRGDNASALIYAATLGDAISIDRETMQVVAVTGNSMGWYSALACSSALSPRDGFAVANTMATLMQDALIGGQLVYLNVGSIGWPGATDTHGLWDDILGHHVTETYGFSRAITIAAREFAPDLFVVTGPGTTRGMANKSDVQARQAAALLLISMGRDDPGQLLTKGT